MVDFTSTLLNAGCGWSTWHSTWQKTAANANGVFYATLVDQNNTNFQSNTLKVFWKATNQSVSEIFSRTGSWACGAIETFVESKQLYLIYSDFTTGAIYIEYWADVTQSTTPTRYTFTGYGTGNIRFTTCIDEHRRCIYFLGDTGYWFTFKDNCTLAFRDYLLRVSGPNYPHQFSIAVAEDGKVWCVWNTAVTNIDLSRRGNGICGLLSVNPRSTSPSWIVSQPTDKHGGNRMSHPIVPDQTGPATWLLWDEEVSGMNTQLCHICPTLDGRIGVLWSRNAYTGAIMQEDDLRSTFMGYDCIPWSGQSSALSAIVKKPLRQADWFLRGESGNLFVRGGNLYCVTHDNGLKLVALKSTDWGLTWTLHARTSVSVVGGGSHMLHHVSGYRGHNNDSTMEGVVCDVKCAPSAWAANPWLYSQNWDVDVYRWTLPLS